MAFALLGLLTACGNHEQSRSQGAKPYQVDTLSPQSVTLYTDYPATIQGQDVVEIRPRIDGYVENIYVDEGATVKKGQLLFTISNPQYEQDLRTAQAGIKTAEASVNSAQITVDKTRALVEKEIISHFELETAELTLQSEKATLAQAQATLANAQANLGYTRITAPVDGVIGLINHKRGSLVSSTSTDPLTTISSAGNMYVYFGVNEKQLLQLSRVLEGKTLQEKLKRLPEVTLLLADGTEYDQPGRVETASGLITTETGSSNLRATFPNPMGILRSGGSGSVRIPRDMDNALLIPQQATYELQGKHFAYKVNQDSTVASTPIETLATPNGQSFVITAGLSTGDVVVAQGVSQLKDGTKISPVVASAAQNASSKKQ